MIVVDTNIISYLFFSSPYSAKAEKVLEKDAEWSAPVLWRSEFRSVLLQYAKRELLTTVETVEIFDTACGLLENGEYQVSTSSVLSLSLESGCSSYDCEYVSLAQELGNLLVTEDKQILRAFPEIAVDIDTYIT